MLRKTKVNARGVLLRSSFVASFRRSSSFSRLEPLGVNLLIVRLADFGSLVPAAAGLVAGAVAGASAPVPPAPLTADGATEPPPPVADAESAVTPETAAWSMFLLRRPSKRRFFL